MIAIVKCLNYTKKKKKISQKAMHITLRFKRNSTGKFENPGDMALTSCNIAMHSLALHTVSPVSWRNHNQ